MARRGGLAGVVKVAELRQCHRTSRWLVKAKSIKVVILGGRGQPAINETCCLLPFFSFHSTTLRDIIINGFGS